MTSQIRNTMLCFAALSLATVAACNNDAKPSTPDVLAQDSTLNLKVMAARNDSNADTAIKSKQAGATATTAGAVAQAPTPARSAPVLHPVAVASRPSTSVRSLSTSTSRIASATRVRRTSRTERRQARLASEVPPRYSRHRAPRTIYRTPARSTVSRTTTTATGTATQPAPANASTVETVSLAPGRTFNMVPTGSSLDLASSQKICTNTSKVGQQFETRLTKDVMGPDGVLIPEGTVATGRIASIGKSDPGIAINISSLTFGGRTYPVGSQVIYTEVDRVETSSRNSGAKIVAGAGLGALLGRMIGGDTKSTVIGAVGGAAAGGVLANAGNTQYAHCVPSGGQIVARLTEPLRVAASN